jgi:predicted DNA binding CopG/RHH family protein
MNKTKLDKDEATLLKSYEADEWRSAKKSKAEAARYRKYAQATFRKDKRVNIRISEKDLVGIQKRAIEEGIPYQTLMSSILHKYLAGTLVEKT